MDKSGINKFLKNEGFHEIDRIDYNRDVIVYKSLYEFDVHELDAAKEYADNNYDKSKGKDEWYEEYYMPYLTDVATDNIRNIFDDIREEYEVEGDFIIYEMDRGDCDSCEVVMVFSNFEIDITLDDIIEELNL